MQPSGRRQGYQSVGHPASSPGVKEKKPVTEEYLRQQVGCGVIEKEEEDITEKCGGIHSEVRETETYSLRCQARTLLTRGKREAVQR